LKNSESSDAGYFRGYAVLIISGILQIRIFKHKKYVHLKNKIMKQYLLNKNKILINGLTKITTTDKGEIKSLV